MVRVALITGASRGIGAATALVLAEHGYRVVVNHRASAPQAEEVVATIAAAVLFGAGRDEVLGAAVPLVPGAGPVAGLIDNFSCRRGRSR
jgi:3-oxoacyl-[acyl-carrier protein] reductase